MNLSRSNWLDFGDFLPVGINSPLLLFLPVGIAFSGPVTSPELHPGPSHGNCEQLSLFFLFVCF